MGRLSETETERVEEHLLVCHPCQDLLTQTDEFVGTMKVATQELASQPELQPAGEPWWRRFFAIPTPVMAAAACAVLALVFFLPRDRQMATVELQTLRGPEAPIGAPANVSLNLRLSLRGIDATGPFRVEIVDAAGDVTQTADATRSADQALAVTEGLSKGIHWVRLYAGEELLREYGLNVR